MLNPKNIVLICIALFIAGCFDLHQRLDVDSNGYAKYKAEVIFNQNLAGMTDNPSDFCNQISISKNNDLEESVKQSNSDGNIVCTILVKGPIEKFNNLRIGKGGDKNVFIKKVSDSVYRISEDYSSTRSEKTGNSSNNEFAQGMIKAMFSGHTVTWDINAPSIINTNGEISNNGKTVHWSEPLSDLISGNARSDNFHADIRIKSSWRDWANEAWYWALSFVYSKEDIQAKREGFENAKEKQQYMQKQEEKRRIAEKKRRQLNNQVQALLDEAKKLRKEHKYTQAITNYKKVLDLDVDKTGSYNISDIKKDLNDVSDEMDKYKTKQEYINKIKIYDLHAKYYETYTDDHVPGVTFKLKNNGDKALNKVEVTVYFQDKNGDTISEEHYHPVNVNNIFGNDDPLKPGYIYQLPNDKFLKAENVPSEWREGSARAEITDIEFANNAGN